MADYEAFFAEHYDEVVRTLGLAVGDRSRAEDAAQEAFAQAFRKWAAVSRMERPVGWVIVVGMNQMKRWLTRVDRRERHHRESVAGLATVGAAGRVGRLDELPDLAERIATAETLREALDRLPARQRATVVLRYLCDLSTDEVARALSCSPGTVKSALSAGLTNLRITLDDTRPDTEREVDPHAHR